MTTSVGQRPPLYSLFPSHSSRRKSSFEEDRSDLSEDNLDSSSCSTTSTTKAEDSPGKRNKRKSLEPKKVTTSSSSLDLDTIKRPRLDPFCSDGEDHTTPSPRIPSPADYSRDSPSPSSRFLAPKKRFKHDALKDLDKEDKLKKATSPFRPWDARPAIPSATPPSATSVMPPAFMTNPDWFMAAVQDQTTRLALSSLLKGHMQSPEPEQEEPLALVKVKKEEEEAEEVDYSPAELADSPRKAKQRNYKNMTRERRVEANARERQRVHTITAAFDTLQNAIPVEPAGCGSKMSKLSIIKIATSYIMCLSRQCGYDYSADKSAPDIEECRAQLEQLIQAESKAGGGPQFMDALTDNNS